jgi:adenylosuccinate lyase
MLGEAIAFALAPKHMSRTEAAVLVKDACQIAIQNNRHLLDVVQEISTAPVDWQAMKDESAYIGLSDEFISRVLVEAKY